MPPDEVAEQIIAAKQIAAADKAAEEKKKREEKAAITEALLDPATIKQLSASGNEAKARRKNYQNS